MKTQYLEVFAKHVGVRLAKAKDLGISASWRTEDHLDALADCIESNPQEVRDVLAECYNVSAFQQQLAKKFEKTPHFQREGKKSPSERLDDVLSKLAQSG